MRPDAEELIREVIRCATLDGFGMRNSPEKAQGNILHAIVYRRTTELLHALQKADVTPLERPATTCGCVTVCEPHKLKPDERCTNLDIPSAESTTMAKDRNGRQHRLREVTDPAVIERLKDQDGATFNDPIGGQDKDGRWYVDTKLTPPALDNSPNGNLPSND